MGRPKALFGQSAVVLLQQRQKHGPAAAATKATWTDRDVLMPCAEEDVVDDSNQESASKMIVNLGQIAWKYRAEGNANLVLAIPETKQVVRLKKVDVDVETGQCGNENFQFLKSVVRYIKEISAFFADDFVINPQLVILFLMKDMDTFNKQLNLYRPVERLSKEIRFPFGIIYPDVTFLPAYLTASRELEPIFCVEIKPKQGWKFNGSEADEAQFMKLFRLEDRTKLAKCRYCSMQHLKYKKGKIHSLSNYCPLDLFSGEIPKMTKAIKNLLDCPQNNLRMFRNGDQVYGDQQYHNSDRLHNAMEEIFNSKNRQRNLHEFTNLLCNILLKEYSLSSSGAQRESRRMEGNLPVNCVLQQILNVQRLVYDFFSTMDLNGDEMNLNCDSSRARITNELLEGNFRRYQYGATALDCSLMITFQRINSDRFSIDEALAQKFVVQHEGGARFMTKIAIMDLDPKPSGESPHSQGVPKPFSHAIKYVEQTQASYHHQNQRQSIL